MDVRMVHPTLPGREIEVPESSVPQHLRAGWERAPERPEPARQSDPLPEQAAAPASEPQTVPETGPETESE